MKICPSCNKEAQYSENWDLWFCNCLIEECKGGLKMCPKCHELTCFVLPDFNLETMEIIGKSCPACKVKEVN
jgi:hypothetical protein